MYIYICIYIYIYIYIYSGRRGGVAAAASGGRRNTRELTKGGLVKGVLAIMI